ncbi:MAG: type II toxin-antitoxin system VapC family toxin [Candidatus Xenobia bacterium]
MTDLYVDTSAFYALLCRQDENHQRAADYLKSAAREKRRLVTTSYALLETLALLQSRIGLDAVRAFDSALRPIVRIQWMDEHLHDVALQRLLSIDRRNISLADCSGFVCMSEKGIAEVFAFDPDFAKQGFQVVPG